MSALRLRPPAVAGLFYPASERELRTEVEALLAAAPEPEPATPAQSSRRSPKAVIAPHAGYVYSGPIAATAFRALAADRRGRLARAVLLGPAHRVPIRGLALPGAEALGTPLGAVHIDPEAAQAAIRLPQVRVQPAAHAEEHSLEVELPFLQMLFGESLRVLPLVVGDASAEEVAEVLEVVWGGEETAIVISSDLSHYHPYDAARRLDADTAERILRLEAPIETNRACGAHPINGLLVAAQRRGLAAELLDLRSSGDTAGDRSRVVGYGAFAFREAAR